MAVKKQYDLYSSLELMFKEKADTYTAEEMYHIILQAQKLVNTASVHSAGLNFGWLWVFFYAHHTFDNRRNRVRNEGRYGRLGRSGGRNVCGTWRQYKDGR